MLGGENIFRVGIYILLLWITFVFWGWRVHLLLGVAFKLEVISKIYPSAGWRQHSSVGWSFCLGWFSTAALGGESVCWLGSMVSCGEVGYASPSCSLGSQSPLYWPRHRIHYMWLQPQQVQQKPTPTRSIHTTTCCQHTVRTSSAHLLTAVSGSNGRIT